MSESPTVPSFGACSDYSVYLVISDVTTASDTMDYGIIDIRGMGVLILFQLYLKRAVCSSG